MMDHNYYVYILCSAPRGTLYIGVTNNLAGRVAQHRDKVIPGFTKKYNVSRLVYFEAFDNVEYAIRR